MKNYKYHYVYRITNVVTGYHYYGDRSCNCLPKKDIGHKYFSSSSLKFFIEDQKLNPNDYKYKIIKVFQTSREDSKKLEVKLHEKFDVKNHHKFINRANQTSSKFDISGLSTTKGQVTVKDKKGNILNISKLEFHNNKNDYVSVSKGLILVKDKITGETLKVKKDEYMNNDRYLHINTKSILVFDGLGEMKHRIYGNFKEECLNLGLPFNALKKSYQKSGEKLYMNSKSNIDRLKEQDFWKYKGWYALKETETH